MWLGAHIYNLEVQIWSFVVVSCHGENGDLTAALFPLFG